MDRQVRRLGIAFVALFGVLFVQVAYVQVIAADRIAGEPGNAARQIRAEYQVERGRILASDRRTVLAVSVPNPDKSSPYAYVRTYPQGELYGQLTGYYSRIYGRSGLEQAMNSYLSGTAPEFTTQNLTDILLGRAKQGGTVITTLVPRVQRAAKAALGSHQGAVVAVDPQTGDILAMYSNPGYDPNPLTSGTDAEIQAAWKQLTNDPDHPLVAHAFQDLYLPGSTFKTVTASAALENGYGPLKPVWPNPHQLDLPGTEKNIENFGNEYCNGGSKVVTMAKAFASSCNVTFAEIGLELGADRLAAQAQAYGFCQTDPTVSPACTNDTIPFILPWQPGRFPVPSYFDNNDPALARSAIGLDNDLYNPLHLALIASTIANGGTLYTPQLVTEVRAATTAAPIREFGPEVYGRPLAASSASDLRQMMVNVVQSGTGTAAQIPNVVVAGKTGTATNGDNVPPNAWFTAFAPAGPQDQPRIAVAVIVLDGGDAGNEATGGRVAAPIAKAVMEAYL
jgi:peptidoglycan glycosyltransferase